MRFHRWLVLGPMSLLSVVASAQTGILLTATSHNFVSVPEGSTQKYGIHVTNQGSSPFAFTLTLTGSPSFTYQTDCPATLQPGKGCEIVFAYQAPMTSQWEEAKFEIATHGATFPNGNSGTLRAHAVPAGVITLNTHKHNFAEVKLGSSEKFGLNVSNGSTSAVPFTYKTTGDSAAYQVETNCKQPLAAGGQCSLVFTFTPTLKAWQNLTVDLETGSIPVDGGSTVTLVGHGS